MGKSARRDSGASKAKSVKKGKKEDRKKRKEKKKKSSTSSSDSESSEHITPAEVQEAVKIASTFGLTLGEWNLFLFAHECFICYHKISRNKSTPSIADRGLAHCLPIFS